MGIEKLGPSLKKVKIVLLLNLVRSIFIDYTFQKMMRLE